MKGITIREALQIMQNSEISYGRLAHNEQTAKAARILMGAYKAQCYVKHCPGIREAIRFFSQRKPAVRRQDGLKDYIINACGKNDYYAMYQRRTYINCDGDEIRTCDYSPKEGFGGHFTSMQAAVEAAKKHKAKRELSQRSFTIERKTNDTGLLLYNVWGSDIADLLNEAGFPFISNHHVGLSKPIREVGLHTVPIKCFGTSIPIKLWVVPLPK